MYRHPLTYKEMLKLAAAVLTPEAEQAAVQPPPADPAAMGGAPMPPQGAPMDPAMQGGAPAPAPGMPGAQSEATGPRGGQIPPEILQDQMFMQFLMEAMGIVFDPNSQMFVDPNGQPVPVEMIMQAYQDFQMALAQQQQAGDMGAAPGGAPMPQEGAPMDAALQSAGAPMDPAAMGGAPADPAAMGGMPPAPEAAPMGAQEEAPMEQPEDPINQIASAVMSGVEAVLQEYTASTEKRISAILDKLEALTKSIDALQSTTDRRDQQAKDADAQLRDEIAADLQPTKTASKRQPTANAPINLFELIQGNK